ELPAERPLVDLCVDARVRARRLRVGGGLVAATDTARQRRLARSARVAEPVVGEPDRPFARLLALLLSAVAADVPRAARVRGRGGVLPGGQQGAPVPDPP